MGAKQGDPLAGGAAGSEHSHHKSVSTTLVWEQALRSSRESSLMGEERTARSAKRGFGSKGEGKEDITKAELGKDTGDLQRQWQHVQGTLKNAWEQVP